MPRGGCPVSPADQQSVDEIRGIEVAQFLALVEVLGEVGPEAGMTLAKDDVGNLHASIVDPDRTGVIRVVVDIDARVRDADDPPVDLPPVLTVGPIGRLDRDVVGRLDIDGGDWPPDSA